MRYHVGDEKIASGPKSLADGWPGLKGTTFAPGISAACSVPGKPTSLYLFKGDQYVLYSVRDEKITDGPKSLASVWGSTASSPTGSTTPAASPVAPATCTSSRATSTCACGSRAPRFNRAAAVR